ncbi:MAG: phage holin family protein [Candidatus Dormibacteraeota bacterium]|nr:phage holin family protein [Candidatus Dormibacteraeota bacterium]MBV9525361.1 phage holin family protein [Candidatus Dormibacteraeota bacterium]
MSDEASRSAHSSGQRRSDGAPAWWAALDRSDLPDGGSPEARPNWYDAEMHHSLRQGAGFEGLPTKRRAWLINVVAILVAVGVIMLGVGVDSPRSALVVGLLFGVPVVLVAITAAVAARHSGG